ncbi:hypothetical protein B5X24_HaOG212030 [Helicoverpa armigera]|nr:hypothetical protein B5X24_HaOG212030 [Helicoverpa armigera]
MVSAVAVCCLLAALVTRATTSPVPLQPLQADSHPLGLVSELSSRLGAHPARLQDARLPLPSPQDLDAIRKVAQILVTLGQQVIPAIIGEPPLPPAPCEAAGGGGEVPNDPVSVNDRQA